MRRLIAPATLRTAVPAGVLLGVLCTPYIHVMSQHPALRTWRLIMFFPLSIVLFQICIAWTMFDGRSRALDLTRPGREYAGLAAGAAVLAVIALMVMDPFLADVRPQFYPQSLKLLLLGMPWSAGLEPLLLVAVPYAFCTRLGGRTWPAVITVVLIHQALWLSRLWGDGGLVACTAIMLLGTVTAVLLALSYRRFGLLGPVLIAAILQVRHVAHLLG